LNCDKYCNSQTKSRTTRPSSIYQQWYPYHRLNNTSLRIGTHTEDVLMTSICCAQRYPYAVSILSYACPLRYCRHKSSLSSREIRLL